jgi:SAM-dependent methyltransferase
MTTHTEAKRRKVVRERYAKAATEQAGCCDSSCCGGAATESAEQVGRSVGYSAGELAALPEGANLGLGCGNPTAIADLAPGLTVLDLGSGAGIDCFLAAERVGPGGRVIGVDMTPEMIEKARANARRSGYTNVEFRLGEIEALPVADASVDVIISNCVLNLSADRSRVLGEALRVLRPGGRIVVSDLVSDLDVPDVIGSDLDAVAGCLPTQRDRYLADFRAAGFADARITSETRYPSDYLLSDEGVQKFLAAHPGQADALRAFAASISGAHFEATRA